MGMSAFHKPEVPTQHTHTEKRERDGEREKKKKNAGEGTHIDRQMEKMLLGIADTLSGVCECVCGIGSTILGGVFVPAAAAAAAPLLLLMLEN